jgi:fibrillin 1
MGFRWLLVSGVIALAACTSLEKRATSGSDLPGTEVCKPYEKMRIDLSYKKLEGGATTKDNCIAKCAADLKCAGIDFNYDNKLCSFHDSEQECGPLLSEQANFFHCRMLPDNCNKTPRKDMCYCQGDPHCHSFDHHSKVDFMGTCKYTLARDNCKDRLPAGDPTWEVIINSDRNIPTDTVSYIKELTVKVYDKDLTIMLYIGRRLVVNGRQLIGFPQKLANGVNVINTPSFVYVIIDKGPQVAWNGKGRVEVSTPDDLKENMCGICGNANGDPSDDWTIGNSEQCMTSFPGATPGQTTTNGNEFGWSWLHSMDEKDKTCKDSCRNPPNPNECSESSTKKAEEHCNVLRDTSGKFAECIAKMPADQANDIFNNCVYDSCHLNEYNSTVCENAASLNKICKAQYGLSITWRSEDLCPLECGEGMEYKVCGSICMPTCKDPKGARCGDTNDCEEGCFCKEGKVFDGNSRCINPEACGCPVPDQDGAYINVGESFLNGDCSKRCTCSKEGADLVCEDNSCKDNEECGIQNGISGCYCNPPFIVDGDDCIEKPSNDEPSGDEPDGDEPDGDEPDGDEPDGDEPNDPSKECGEGMVFKECASECWPTCDDIYNQSCNSKRCVAKCACKDGYVYDCYTETCQPAADLCACRD